MSILPLGIEELLTGAAEGVRLELKARIGTETCAVHGDIQRQLIEQTARIPFDDRRSYEASNEHLSLPLLKAFLTDVGSELATAGDSDWLLEKMLLTRRINGHSVPRNVALLFFSEAPQRWFRGARIEVVQFSEDGGDALDERQFTGPLPTQLQQCLTWLSNLTTTRREKLPDSIQARDIISYPQPALREALVNAVYHRSYEECIEPVKVYLYPDRVEIISYPGPVYGIERIHLEGGRPAAHPPARNRRIGELLKELRLAEGRGTGVLKIHRTMRENGSPPPQFDFDERRTYFRVTLPAHPEYVSLSVLRAYSYDKATGEEMRALATLEDAWQRGQRSSSIAAALIRELAERGRLDEAAQIGADLGEGDTRGRSLALIALATALLEGGRNRQAQAVLDRLPATLAEPAAVDAAIAERRLGREERAHAWFSVAGESALEDSRALLEFAQCKFKLAEKLLRRRRASLADTQARSRLLVEARDALERALQLPASDHRHAWAWFELARVKRDLGLPRSEQASALEQAIRLDPHERRFTEALARVRGQP